MCLALISNYLNILNLREFSTYQVHEMALILLIQIQLCSRNQYILSFLQNQQNNSFISQYENFPQKIRDKIHNGYQVLQELNKTKEIKQQNSQPSTIQNQQQNYEAKRVQKMKTEQTTKVDISIEKKPSTSQTKLDQSPQPKKPIQTYRQLLQQKYIQNTKKPSISKPVVQCESKSSELKKRDQPTQPVTQQFSFHTEGNEILQISNITLT
ncbi:hypothetical protein pb186bvf_000789 [Paramecium bursaria]